MGPPQLIEHIVRLDRQEIAVHDTSCRGILRIDLEEVRRPSFGGIPAADVVEHVVPDRIDATVEHPDLVLRLVGSEHGIAPGDLVPVGSDEDQLVAVGLEGHVCVLAHGFGQLAVLEREGSLQAGGSEGPEQIVAPHAVGLGLLDQCQVVASATGGALGGDLEDLVGIGEVEALEAHLVGHLGEDPPVGAGLAGRVGDLLVQSEATLGVVAGVVLLTPRCRRQHDVGVRGRVVLVDFLVDDHDATGIDLGLELRERRLVSGRGDFGALGLELHHRLP